jgi:hypothetical protein
MEPLHASILEIFPTLRTPLFSTFTGIFRRCIFAGFPTPFIYAEKKGLQGRLPLTVRSGAQGFINRLRPAKQATGNGNYHRLTHDITIYGGLANYNTI